MVRGFDREGPLFVLGHFLQTGGRTAEEPCGPPCGHGAAGTGLASESLLSQEPTGPHVPCLPSRLWAPRLGGGVWRSTQAESSSLGYPKILDKWSLGGQLAVDTWTGVGAWGPALRPHPSARELVTSSRRLTAVLTLLCHPLGELSKRSSRGISPTPRPRTGRPSPGISAPRAAGP